MVFILPCVFSLDEDLSTNNSLKTDSDGELEPQPGSQTTEQSLAGTDRDYLIEEEEEGLQNISEVFLGNWTDGVLNPIYSIEESQDNRTELDSEDVEILRLGEKS